ncbi:sialate O-acetylesterase [Bacteroides sp.]|uniref:sialate O-acetylesterase n=1 Tax=Bacteroides sp. TaxID=29523 RepID=UPI002632BCF3|nr:sialate O-acetylesterase [Bacteroides sp.]MDD3036547.1 sialate O-acetylesterase [Bacteroides sp.]
MNKNFTISLFFLLGTAALSAQVKLLPIFSDNMVLQQKTQAPVWGETEPNKNVEIITSWNRKKYVIQADTQGKWKTKVETPKAGGPYTITISDGKPVKLNNVMIGEVWVCSGQSNMEMQVEGWGKVLNYEQEKEDANNYPNIRFLLIEKAISPKPVENITAAGNGWQVCSSKSVANFSAVGYFFGRDLNKYRNVPIGLIDTSWGGTIIETWTSNEALATMPSMQKRLEPLEGLPASQEGRKKKFEADVESWKANIEKIDKGCASGEAVWASTNFDDHTWKSMKIPGVMQERGLQGFNGLVWFRKTIDIPASWAGKELTLNVGVIDDHDCTYFNGVQIGRTEGCVVSRIYKIPGSLVKGGKAVIAVRVLDTGGTGGINGSPESISLRLSDSDAIQMAGDWKYQVSLNMREIAPIPVDMSSNPNIPTFLFNAMLNPLIPYAIKGAIWYQGEGNTGEAYQYRELMPLMITDWRNHWGYDFPFYMVQLANFMAQPKEPVESIWAELREAQTRTLKLENTGMAVTIDIGDANDIHPKNKQEVGRRLALAARAQTYGEKISYSGPMYDTYQIEENTIRIYFKHADKGLKTSNGEKVKGFAIAGVDHKFHWADAVIKGNTIVVSSPEVILPIAVRYAWADNPVCNLYNGVDLPASPFRTDDWR